MGGLTWPDGRSLLDQPIALIEAFGIIAEIKNHFAKRNEGADASHRR